GAELRVRHKIGSPENDDFMVRTLEEMASVQTETLKTMTTLLASIAGVSLLVGGIGIMNIMLVSVTERTREIGLRMAIGARGKDVLLQFLVEAIVLSMIGGMIGIGMGFGLSAAVQHIMQWPADVSPDAIALAFGFAALTGVFFGFYPARKAASLDPIEALRFEETKERKPMRRTLGLTAVLVVALAVAGFAQKPDFSGTWTPEPNAAAPAGGGGGGGGRGMGGPMTVKQSATELSVETQGRNGPQTRAYNLDGAEHDVQMGQATVKYSAKWDGSKLVITTKTEQGEATQTWSLDGGKVTIARTGGRGPSSTTYTKGS